VAALPLPARRDAAILQALRQRAAAQPPRVRAGRTARTARRQLTALAMTGALALGAVAGLLHMKTTTPVSAAALILRHAASAAAPNGQALHTSYTITSPQGVRVGGSASLPSVTLDTWSKRDASGGLSEALTFSSPSGGWLGHTIITGQTATIYDASGNAVATASVAQSSPVLDHPFDPASLAQFVSALAQGADPHAQALPSQTLDGNVVDVVQIDRTNAEGDQSPSTVTLYVDARTYVLRRLDVAVSGAHPSTTTFQLIQYASVPVTSVPAQTFPLTTHALSTSVGTSVANPPSTYQQLSVAQAIAQAGVPAPLLVGTSPINGLRLRDVARLRTAQFAQVVYRYEDEQKDVESGKRDVVVVLGTGRVDQDPMFAPAQTTGQPLTLIVAGTTVRATLYQQVVQAPWPEWFLTYTQGTVRVKVGSVNLSRGQFLQAVGALVDGRTHLAEVARLQRDLDTSRRATTRARTP